MNCLLLSVYHLICLPFPVSAHSQQDIDTDGLASFDELLEDNSIASLNLNSPLVQPSCTVDSTGN